MCEVQEDRKYGVHTEKSLNTNVYLCVCPENMIDTVYDAGPIYGMCDSMNDMRVITVCKRDVDNQAQFVKAMLQIYEAKSEERINSYALETTEKFVKEHLYCNNKAVLELDKKIKENYKKNKELFYAQCDGSVDEFNENEFMDFYKIIHNNFVSNFPYNLSWYKIVPLEVMLYKDVLKEIADEVGSNLWIEPMIRSNEYDYEKIDCIYAQAVIVKADCMSLKEFKRLHVLRMNQQCDDEETAFTSKRQDFIFNMYEYNRDLEKISIL